jgi:hypothetical protein
VIIALFHDAFQADHKIFITQIFFEGQSAIRRTREHREYILHQFELVKTSPTSTMNQIQAVNLYRSVVSDLYDPYLSIIVACIKLIEGAFDSFVGTNLSSTEFRKYEFASARLKGSVIFNGYFALIRNAVSHTGTHSITYEKESIIFKKVKRSVVPEITEVIQIGTDQLISYIQSLIDFTTAVDVCMNVFGLDAAEYIVGNAEIANSFADLLAMPEDFEVWRQNSVDYYAKVWSNPETTEQSKLEYFAKEFAKACAKHGMYAKQITFKQQLGIVVIEVPGKSIDMSDDQEISSRAIELIRYSLLAEPLFHFRFKSYLVAEAGKASNDSMQVWMQGEDLKDYILRKASIFDLIQDGKIFKNKVDLGMYVDFPALQQIQIKSLMNFRKGKAR